MPFGCSNSENAKVEREISGRVIRIKDGDTIEILYDGMPLTIRLAHIDCPEKNQPFGTIAKKFISDLCFDQVVTIENDNKFDRYRRLIGVIITPSGDTINKELVKAGLAWHFKVYSLDQEYSTLEMIAREKKLGLWVDENATAPWVWR